MEQPTGIDPRTLTADELRGAVARGRILDYSEVTFDEAVTLINNLSGDDGGRITSYGYTTPDGYVSRAV